MQQARKDEINQFKKHIVYKKVPITKCWDEAGAAPVGSRWLDIYKGDKVNPAYRSRLVAQEIAIKKREDRFAATPPLEAKIIPLNLVLPAKTAPVPVTLTAFTSDFIF